MPWLTSHSTLERTSRFSDRPVVRVARTSSVRRFPEGDGGLGAAGARRVLTADAELVDDGDVFEGAVEAGDGAEGFEAHRAHDAGEQAALELGTGLAHLQQQHDVFLAQGRIAGESNHGSIHVAVGVHGDAPASAVLAVDAEVADTAEVCVLAADW